MGYSLRASTCFPTLSPYVSTNNTQLGQQEGRIGLVLNALTQEHFANIQGAAKAYGELYHIQPYSDMLNRFLRDASLGLLATNSGAEESTLVQ